MRRRHAEAVEVVGVQVEHGAGRQLRERARRLGGGAEVVQLAGGQQAQAVAAGRGHLDRRGVEADRRRQLGAGRRRSRRRSRARRRRPRRRGWRRPRPRPRPAPRSPRSRPRLGTGLGVGGLGVDGGRGRLGVDMPASGAWSPPVVWMPSGSAAVRASARRALVALERDERRRRRRRGRRSGRGARARPRPARRRCRRATRGRGRRRGGRPARRR